jgi:hypothetical protein
MLKSGRNIISWNLPEISIILYLKRKTFKNTGLDKSNKNHLKTYYSKFKRR